MLLFILPGNFSMSELQLLQERIKKLRGKGGTSALLQAGPTEVEASGAKAVIALAMRKIEEEMRSKVKRLRFLDL